MVTLWQLDELLEEAEALAGDALSSWSRSSFSFLFGSKVSVCISQKCPIFELVQCVGPAFTLAIYKVGF